MNCVSVSVSGAEHTALARLKFKKSTESMCETEPVKSD